MNIMVLTAQELSKRYGQHAVLQGVALSVAERQTLSVLGRSGCGKTTLLKIIAGLVPPDTGTVWLHGAEISRKPAEQRNVVYLYQEPLLFPHLTVVENIAFGLRIRRVPSGEINNRVGRMLEHLGLEAHAKKMPHQLSGGQKQRVAFGRAIIITPDVLLLDEPFSSLDPETRASMQKLFKRLAQEYGIASLFVTHDLKEAILMGDSIGYMANGRLETFATRQEFINHPAYGAREEIAFWEALSQQASTEEYAANL